GAERGTESRGAAESRASKMGNRIDASAAKGGAPRLAREPAVERTVAMDSGRERGGTGPCATARDERKVLATRARFAIARAPSEAMAAGRTDAVATMDANARRAGRAATGGSRLGASAERAIGALQHARRAEAVASIAARRRWSGAGGEALEKRSGRRVADPDAGPGQALSKLDARRPPRGGSRAPRDDPSGPRRR